MVLGDRYETFAAAQAAFCHRIPLIHFHGGETTEGAVDDTFRTCISAFSDLHFVAAEPFKQKLVSMGILPNKIFTSGAPSLERIKTLSLMKKEDFLSAEKFKNIPKTDEVRSQEAIQGILDSHEEKFIVVAFNPVTRLSDLGRQERDALIEAIKDLPIQLILSLGYADPGCLEFNEAFKELSEYRKNRDVILYGNSIYQYIYYLTRAQMIIGNSSSGLIEAPFLKTPSINVGVRQKGRLSSGTTLHVPAEKEAILRAIQKAGTLEWKNKVRGDASPYGNGTATRKIIPIIRKWLIEKYPGVQ
jgi:UDP-hydrolysing UDP-N-acetyl-D-glucosamine 2-epimerase